MIQIRLQPPSWLATWVLLLDRPMWRITTSIRLLSGHVKLNYKSQTQQSSAMTLKFTIKRHITGVARPSRTPRFRVSRCTSLQRFTYTRSVKVLKSPEELWSNRRLTIAAGPATYGLS